MWAPTTALRITTDGAHDRTVNLFRTGPTAADHMRQEQPALRDQINQLHNQVGNMVRLDERTASKGPTIGLSSTGILKRVGPQNGFR